MQSCLYVSDTVKKEYSILKENFISEKGELSEDYKINFIRKNHDAIVRFQSVLQQEYKEPVCGINVRDASMIINVSLSLKSDVDHLIVALINELYIESVSLYIRTADRINLAIEKLGEEQILLPKFRYNKKLVTPLQASISFGNRENNPKKLRLIVTGYSQRSLLLSDETREITIKDATNMAYKLEWTYEHRKTDSTAKK